MLQNLLHRFSIGIKIIRLFKNWYKMTIYFSEDKNISPILELRKGLKFYTNNNLLDVVAIVENFGFENEHDYFKMTNILKKSCIIDIGANIGAFSIYTATRFPDAEIFSYEPDPKNFEKFIKNIELNKIKNISPHNQAVGKIKGNVNLYSDNKGNFGTVGSSLVNTGPKYLVISCVTLDDILKDNHIEKCDFLKIDCEGGEYDIIFNSNKDTFMRIKSITLEYHDIVNHQLNELESFLKNMGYHITKIPNKRNPKFGLIYAKLENT